MKCGQTSAPTFNIMPDFHLVSCSCHGQMIWVRSLGVVGDADTQVSRHDTFVVLTRGHGRGHFLGGQPGSREYRANPDPSAHFQSTSIRLGWPNTNRWRSGDQRTACSSLRCLWSHRSPTASVPVRAVVPKPRTREWGSHLFLARWMRHSHRRCIRGPTIRSIRGRRPHVLRNNRHYVFAQDRGKDKDLQLPVRYTIN